MLPRIGFPYQPDQQGQGNSAMKQQSQEYSNEVKPQPAYYLADFVPHVNLLCNHFCCYAEDANWSEPDYEQGDLHNYIQKGVYHIQKDNAPVVAYSGHEKSKQNRKEDY